jgi:hypothetical protein
LTALDSDIIVEGEGTSEEMHAHVQRVVAENGWTNRAKVGYVFEFAAPENEVGPYRVWIRSSPR